MTTDADAMVILANSIDLLAQAIDKMAEASFSPGGAAPNAMVSAPVPPSGPPSAPPGGHSNGEESTQVKRGKKIYAVCRQNNWDIADIGQRVTGHAVNPNSQKWSEADQVAVLDAFKEWNVG